MEDKPYAAQEKILGNRNYPEKPHPYRSEFQRDRDRIVHSRAFRRLEYKTQVFVNHLGDNYRTRLTHSIEVSQISRSVTRALGINEDLTETIALAHDLGHPPFGHAGEKALHHLMTEHNGFDHNEQTLRIVEKLESRYPEHEGLNLTEGTLMGLQKHSRLPRGMSHTIEAQVVDICDEIAYNNHDLDDGIDSGFLQMKHLSEVELWNTHWETTLERFPDANPSVQVRFTIRNIINAMVTNLIETTKSNIETFHIQTLNDVLKFQENYPEKQLVSLSQDMKTTVVQLKKFLMRSLYRHPEVLKMSERANRITETLFKYFYSHPDKLPPEYRSDFDQVHPYRAVADFIAGMTDRYAHNVYRELKALE